ncbi:MAG TPA: response regulator transcription factor [Gammaproteobacteria bacterium]|nr:response regulator transcription factor [Gammaproteobacteria bacterium]
MRIAYLEDDRDQAALIRRWLEGAGHACDHFERGHALRRSLARESYDLYLLDWQVPDDDGVEVLREIRSRAPGSLVIFATARGRDDDIAHVLQAGADDYITKPVRQGELLGRIQALARRRQGDSDVAGEPIVLPPYTLQRRERRVLRDGEPIALTHREYELAAFLFQNVDKLLSRRHLQEAVWGLGAKVQSRTVDTHVSRLRAKLGLSEERGWRLSSVHQFGYRLERINRSS